MEMSRPRSSSRQQKDYQQYQQEVVEALGSFQERFIEFKQDDASGKRSTKEQLQGYTKGALVVGSQTVIQNIYSHVEQNEKTCRDGGIIGDGVGSILWCISSCYEVHDIPQQLRKAANQFPEFAERAERIDDQMQKSLRNVIDELEYLQTHALHADEERIYHRPTRIQHLCLSFRDTYINLKYLVQNIEDELRKVNSRKDQCTDNRNESLVSTGDSLVTTALRASSSDMHWTLKLLNWIPPIAHGAMVLVNQINIFECSVLIDQLHEQLETTNKSGRLWQDAFDRFTKANISDRDLGEIVAALPKFASQREQGPRQLVAQGRIE